jgi:2,4-dienoyl-CoA reductase-like NADH-dependent reductase (Old Yellow Enzyme family)
MDIRAVNLSVGSPYYNPHIQRPATYPPSDGYLPPEDPLAGVGFQIDAVRRCKRAVPELVMVGSGYTYLQEWLPHVAQYEIREGYVDVVGIGRMVLAYPELPADVLAGRTLQRKRLCRTFSDCTTGPRHGMLSGCFPLDDHYRSLPEAARIKEIKEELDR